MGLQDFLKKNKKMKDEVADKENTAAVVRTQVTTPTVEPTPTTANTANGSLSKFLSKMKGENQFNNPLTTPQANLTQEQVEEMPEVETRSATLGTRVAVVSTPPENGSVESTELPIGGSDTHALKEVVLGNRTLILKSVDNTFKALKALEDTINLAQENVLSKEDLVFTMVAIESKLNAKFDEVSARLDAVEKLINAVEKPGPKYTPTVIQEEVETAVSRPEEFVCGTFTDSSTEEPVTEVAVEGASVHESLVAYIKSNKPTRKSEITEAVVEMAKCTPLEVTEALTELMDAGYIGKDGRKYVVHETTSDAEALTPDGDDGSVFPDGVDVEVVAELICKFYEGMDTAIPSQEFAAKCLNLLGGQFPGLSKANILVLVGPDALDYVDADGVIQLANA